MERIWPLRDLHDAGTLVAAGSYRPVAMPVPNPWLSIETMVTRRSPDPAFPGSLAAGQALDLGTPTSRFMTPRSGRPGSPTVSSTTDHPPAEPGRCSGDPSARLVN